MKSRLYGLLIPILFLTSCVGATPPPNIETDDQVDRSLFTGIPCAAPCWHGLEVGKSSESEVMSTVQKLEYINPDTIQISQNSSGKEIIASCLSPDKECLKFNVSNDFLTRIAVSLNYEIRADEAIEQLGDPHYLGVSPAHGEIVACEVYMIWRDRGLVLASVVTTSSEAVDKHCEGIRNTGKIPPGLLIAEARLISGMELITLLTSEGQFFDYSMSKSQ